MRNCGASVAEKDADTLSKKAVKRYKYVVDAWRKQRAREAEDLKFQIGEYQWTDQARAERQGRMVNGVPAPARPIISINKLSQPRQLIRNQRRQAKLGINIHPKSPDATPETAQTIQGLYRSIEQDSNADDARGWAYDRAVDCGFGCYRVTTDYDNEAGRDFDQVIRIERILRQEAVYLDPSATKPDYSDGKFAFVTSWMQVDEFRAMYPDAEVPEDADKTGFDSMIERTPDWVRYDGETYAVLVAEYWYKEFEQQTFVEMPDGSVAIEEELPEKQPKEARRRKHVKQHVFVCKLAPGGDSDEGIQHIEGPEEWNGQWIPLIPVIGEELVPFNDERRFQGIIADNKDAQRAYNYSASTLIERMALEPKAPFLLDPDQIEGYESEWLASNQRNLPFLPYKRFIGAKDYGIPERAQVDASGASLAVLGLQQFDDFIQAGTYAYNPSLGKQQPQRSGKAILAEQQQFETSSSGYLYNLADKAMNYEARVVLDLMPKIYDSPGRIARVLDEEGQSEQVMLNAPFYADQDGAPQPWPQDGGIPPDAERQEFNLTEGVYSVTITVGKSFQSQRQEGGQVIGEILQARPELLPVLGPLWAKFQDFPGSQEFTKLLLKMRAMTYPGLDDEQTPEQAMAENFQLKQQMQQMQQQMQMMDQALQTKQVEQQATLQKAEMDNQVKVQTTQMNNETQLAIAALKAEMDQIREAIKGQQDRETVKEKTRGDVDKAAAQTALTPPEYKGSADKPLPSPSRF